MSAGNFTKSYEAQVGINHVPAYQVSGVPFVSGGINASSGVVKIQFPYVTRWIYVVNHGAADCKIGFSSNGTTGTNYLRVGPENGSAGTQHTVRLEVKVSEIYLTGSDSVDVMAGLTGILPKRLNTASGTSWSGSSGVG